MITVREPVIFSFLVVKNKMNITECLLDVSVHPQCTWRKNTLDEAYTPEYSLMSYHLTK